MEMLGEKSILYCSYFIFMYVQSSAFTILSTRYIRQVFQCRALHSITLNCHKIVDPMWRPSSFRLACRAYRQLLVVGNCPLSEILHPVVYAEARTAISLLTNTTGELHGPDDGSTTPLLSISSTGPLGACFIGLASPVSIS